MLELATINRLDEILKGQQCGTCGDAADKFKISLGKFKYFCRACLVGRPEPRVYKTPHIASSLVDHDS